MSPSQLPVEIVASVCDLVATHHLPGFMLVSKSFRCIAEKRLYAVLDVDLFDPQRRVRATKCLHTLTQNPFAAEAVKCITARGLGVVGHSLRDLFVKALECTTGLLALSLLLLVTPDTPLFPEHLPLDFLPRLSALNVDDPDILVQLVPGRPVNTVRAEDTISGSSLDHVLAVLFLSTSSIQHLQIRVGATGQRDILASFFRIATGAPFRNLVSLGLQFVLPPPSLAWEPLQTLLDYMASTLTPLHTLRTISLITLPDSMLPPDQILPLTRGAMEMILSRLPYLERIEIRWHGWLRDPVTHEWTPIPQNKLLRREWIFRDWIVKLGG
ncbi:hypothetical protein BDM02DRAFT_3121320 [Thelephora ganbajun]|uniref:Uncharacterized protein n=1 Tax=Thelephora ganbajun TaxID=370292 RepID=A0ACB6Z5A6_THEGA|nr:hypothetical protein BDM02DRAFT_3121320 [Thelephora ganbajun]